MDGEDPRITQARSAAAEAGGPASVRVDVWLWSVRQVRSRSAATAACRAGHVRVNGASAKPAQHVVVGDEVRYRVQGFDRDLVVLRLLSKRVGAPIARTAYLDRTPPRPALGRPGRHRARPWCGAADEEGTARPRPPA